MPCLGCFNKTQKSTNKPFRLSLYVSDSRTQSRRSDKSILKVMEELSEATYGLVLEGNQNRPYEAQDFFAFMEILGSGVMSVVFRAYFKPTGKIYAVKFIPNFKQARNFVSRELTILQISEGCRYIVLYHSHFRVGENMYFVMELCEGGTLENLMGKKSLIPPRLGRVYLKELTIALMFLHDKKFVHRDVHMANCLLTNTAHLRLTDFGLSRRVEDSNGEMMTICGRAAIRAPEMYLDKLCGFGLDWWSMGVILYRFVTGYYPFQTDKLTQGFQSVTKLKEKYPDWLFEDPATTDLCQQLLEKDPKQRIGYRNENEIKTHPYFSSVKWNVEDNIKEILEHGSRNISTTYVPVFRRLSTILGVYYHPLFSSKGIYYRGSEISVSSRWSQDNPQPRSFADQIKDFLVPSMQERTRRNPTISLRSNDTLV